MSDHELQKEWLALDTMIFERECYSAGDHARLRVVNEELDRRRIIISE